LGKVSVKKEITEFAKFKESTTDLVLQFWKNVHERTMCYYLNAAVDVNGYFLGHYLSSGNVHDSKNYQP